MKNDKSMRASKSKSLSASLKWILALTVLVIVISFFISIVIINRNERRSYAIRSSENTLRSLSSTISSDMENYKELSRIIMTDDRLSVFLRSDESNVDTGMINDARYGVLDILYVTEGVDSFMVFRNDMIMMMTNRGFYNYDYALMNDESWKNLIYEKKGKAVTTLNCFGIAKRSDGRNVVTIGREINDILSQKRTGIMLMNISQDVFQNMLVRLDLDKTVCIIGQGGEFLAGNSELMSYYDESFDSEDVTSRDVRSGGKDMLISLCKVNDLPVVLIHSTDFGSGGIPYGIVNTLVILMGVFVISVAVIAFVIRKRITKPVFDLSKRIDESEQSKNLERIEDDLRYSELNMLRDSYNKMIDHVDSLIGEVIEKEKTVQRMEMRVLQEQIKPHFLYNSLETIGYLALEAKADKVSDALETLGSFYRNFLSKGSREITLEREISIVRDYITLQKLRYGDIIEDVYDVDEKAASFVVPKLILQPVVENSIYHGIREKGEKGTITITAKVEYGRLHLSVTDTGVGMSPDAIDAVLQKEKPNKEIFGLWDTIERIRIYTGRDDVAFIESESGEYTKVEFVI